MIARMALISCLNWTPQRVERVKVLLGVGFEAETKQQRLKQAVESAGRVGSPDLMFTNVNLDRSSVDFRPVVSECEIFEDLRT